jgi:hypothetical protein
MKLDTIRFEVDYDDGRTEYEHNGLTYGQINRPRMTKFRLRDHHGPIFEIGTDETRSGWNFVMRRRTVDENGEKVLYHVLGWIPMGPMWALNTETMNLYQAPMFIPDDPIFYVPQPHPWEGEMWQVTKAAKIVNPLLERTD